MASIDINTPELINLLSARYGFNTTTLRTFLSSPAGKVLKTTLAEEALALQQMRAAARLSAKEQAREKALHAFLRELIHEKKEAEDERREQIEEQKLIDEQIAAEKEANKDALNAAKAASGKTIYAQSAELLDEAIGTETKQVNDIHAEWDALEEALSQHEAESNLLDRFNKDINSLFETLSDEEEQHFLRLKTPELQLLRRTYKKVEQDGKTYLIEKNQELNALSPEAQAKAHETFKALAPRLKTEIALTRENEMKQLETKKLALIQKSAAIHETIRNLTQHLNIADKTHTNHHALSASYKLLQRELQFTSKFEQAQPIFNALRDDVITKDEVDFNHVFRNGGPMGERMLEFRAGAVKTANHTTQMQLMQSLLRHENKLAAFIGRAPTSDVSHQEEEKHTPSFHPTPFNTKPSGG